MWKIHELLGEDASGNRVKYFECSFLKVLSQPVCYKYFIASLVAFVDFLSFFLCLFLSGTDPTTTFCSSIICTVHNIKYSITCSLVIHIVVVLFTSTELGDLDVTSVLRSKILMFKVSQALCTIFSMPSLFLACNESKFDGQRHFDNDSLLSCWSSSAY